MADKLLGWWLAGPWLLLLLPLLVRVLPRPAPVRQAWSWRLDPALALGVALGSALLCNAVMVESTSQYFPLSCSDFEHYCELSARSAEGAMGDFWNTRFPAPSWLPGLLSGPFTLIDGMAIQSFLALMGTAVGLYVWALSLHGSSAAVLAAALLGFVGPLSFMGRDLSFYPVVVSTSTLTAAFVAASFRFRGVMPSLAVGFFGGLCLLSDVRGVLFAGPLLVVGVLIAAVRGRGPRGAGLRLAAVLLPLVASWLLGHATINEKTIGLERQAYLYTDHAIRDAGGPGYWLEGRGESIPEPTFKWGHSSPLQLPSTYLFLRHVTDSVPVDLAHSEATRDLREGHVIPLLAPGAVGLLLALVAVARRPWRLAALVLTAAPFAMMFQAAAKVLPQERFLATSTPALVLALGIGVALLSEGFPADPEPKAEGLSWRTLPWRRLALLVGIALALGGVIPNWMSGEARWRRSMVQSEPRQTLVDIAAGEQSEKREFCSLVLRRQMDQHAYWPSRLYPRCRAAIAEALEERAEQEAQGD